MAGHPPIPMFIVGLLIGKRPFQDGQCLNKTALFRAHCQKVTKTHYSSAEHRRPHCKINIVHHLAMQSEALVILLQEIHCTDAEKLVLTNCQLVVSSLSRKHGLATFVHERLRYTLLDQSPLTSEIEWLCVDVDGYKIINVYKPPPTRLRTLDLPVYPHPCLYPGNFNCRHADWGYNDNSPDGECLAGWASINCLALLYNVKDAASFFPPSGKMAPIRI